MLPAATRREIPRKQAYRKYKLDWPIPMDRTLAIFFPVNSGLLERYYFLFGLSGGRWDHKSIKTVTFQRRGSTTKGHILEKHIFLKSTYSVGRCRENKYRKYKLDGPIANDRTLAMFLRWIEGSEIEMIRAMVIIMITTVRAASTRRKMAEKSVPEI